MQCIAGLSGRSALKAAVHRFEGAFRPVFPGFLGVAGALVVDLRWGAGVRIVVRVAAADAESMAANPF